VDASGVDVVVLLDVSRSMDARDVAPSRLVRARRNAELVLSSLEPGDRAALAAYAGRGVLLTPLTADHAALLDVLPSVDGELMRLRTSNLDDGVRAMLAAFDPASLRPRVLLVLGDGEDPSGRGDEQAAAAEAARAGVRILAVALGSDAGSPVPDHGAALRDAAGEVVRTRRDAARLAALATRTGGRLLRTDAFGALDPSEAVREIRRDAATAPGESVERRVPALQATPFAALAFALLAVELLASLSLRRPSLRWRTALRVGAVLGLVLLAWPQSRAGAQPAARSDEARTAAEIAALEAQAARAPFEPRTLLRLGLARARAGMGPEAERAFLAAALLARDPALASLAYFDLGVSALERGELEVARDAFFDTLALAPRDEEARFNLEWTLGALREEVPPPARKSKFEQTQDKAGDSPEEQAGGNGENERGDRGPSVSGPERGDAGAPDATPGSGAALTGSESRASQTQTAGELAGAQAPDLSAAEAARWLRAVQDDPGRALREAARQAGADTRAGARISDW
jgi:Ca-activated chloride channel family protein